MRRHRHLPAGICARRRARRSRQRALCRRRGRAGQGADARVAGSLPAPTILEGYGVTEAARSSPATCPTAIATAPSGGCCPASRRAWRRFRPQRRQAALRARTERHGRLSVADNPGVVVPPRAAGTTPAISSPSTTASSPFAGGPSGSPSWAARWFAGRRRDARLQLVAGPARRPRLPDPRKGEQLLLVTDKPDANKDALLAHARKEGFSDSGCRKTFSSCRPCRYWRRARSTCRRPSKWPARRVLRCNRPTASQCANLPCAQAGVARPQRRREIERYPTDKP